MDDVRVLQDLGGLEADLGDTGLAESVLTEMWLPRPRRNRSPKIPWEFEPHLSRWLSSHLCLLTCLSFKSAPPSRPPRLVGVIVYAAVSVGLWSRLFGLAVLPVWRPACLWSRAAIVYDLEEARTVLRPPLLTGP